MDSNSLSLMSEHLFKRVKRFRIVCLKPGLQDLRFSKGTHKKQWGVQSSKKLVVDTLKITQFCSLHDPE